MELISLCGKTLLLDHAKWIVDQGLDIFLDTDDQIHLRLFYELYVRINAMEDIRRGLSGYIRKRGTTLIMMDEEKTTFTVTYDMLQLNI
jgi:hypothetical protein